MMSRLSRQVSFLIGVLMLIPWVPVAFAAREEQTFEVFVDIPTYWFFVLPVDPHFLQQEQLMSWDVMTESLRPIRTTFNVVGARGTVTARLGYTPVLSNGRNLIALAVTFNQQPLTLSDTPVVVADDSWPGKRVQLLIEAVKPATGFIPGQYYGSVQIIFDAPPT